MSLEINGKRIMNLQEAVAWLLANNALPFQSTANYTPNTEIAKTTIINPSPAEIKVGALVLFADSKIGTVSGITTNGFMVGSDYTNIADALAYISQVEINASGHLITTLSNGETKDAGLVKQISSFAFDSSRHLIATYNNGTTANLGLIKGVSSFSINASQHLIVTYDNGTTADLGSLGDFSNVDFTAKTLKQTNANFTASFSQTSSYGNVTAIYNRFIVINNVLHIIYNVKLTSNGTGIPPNDIVTYGQSSALTSAIAQKIIDLNGNSVHEAGPYCTIAKVPAIITKGKLYNSDDILNCTLVLYNINAADYIGFYIMNDTGATISLSNGEEIYVMARMQLTLI